MAEVDDACDDAITIDNVTSGLEISGSTRGGSQYRFNDWCINTRASPASVYKIQMPLTSQLSVSVESNDFDAQVVILKSDGFDAQECNEARFGCVDSNYKSAGLSWEARALETYYVVVYGCCDPTQVGDFALRFEMAKVGNVCEDVVNLVLPEDGLILKNSTNDAPTYGIPSSCYEVSLSSPTILHSISASRKNI